MPTPPNRRQRKKREAARIFLSLVDEIGKVLFKTRHNKRITQLANELDGSQMEFFSLILYN